MRMLVCGRIHTDTHNIGREWRAIRITQYTTLTYPLTCTTYSTHKYLTHTFCDVCTPHNMNTVYITHIVCMSKSWYTLYIHRSIHVHILYTLVYFTPSYRKNIINNVYTISSMHAVVWLNCLRKLRCRVHFPLGRFYLTPVLGTSLYIARVGEL